MAAAAGQARPLPPEEAAQDAALEGLQQAALPGPRVSEQLQLDAGLDGLSVTQLLDEAQLVVVLQRGNRNKKGFRRTLFGHLKESRFRIHSNDVISHVGIKRCALRYDLLTRETHFPATSR